MSTEQTKSRERLPEAVIALASFKDGDIITTTYNSFTQEGEGSGPIDLVYMVGGLKVIFQKIIEYLKEHTEAKADPLTLKPFEEAFEGLFNAIKTVGEGK